MSDTKVVTGKVRFSYANVWEPTAIEEGKPKKYNVSILIPKKDKKGLAKIEAAIEAAVELAKAKYGGKLPKGFKLPLRDGDEDKDDEAYEGTMFFSASSNRKPQIVDEDVQPILDRDEFYSGCYGRASINFYLFDVSGSKGIAAGLNNLQKLEDGEHLGGGGSSAEDDFGDEDDLN